MATIRTERAVAPLQPKDAAAMHDPATTPWELVNNAIALRSSDAQFWWQRAGRIFARLLEAAHYAPDKQIAELTFFALFVAPELGPAPDPSTGEVARWKSPATPDCTPMDFSWEWSARGTVRYAFEPIGPQAGTSADPLNRHATDLWIKKLQAYGLVPGLDTSWYDHFARQVLPQDDIVRTKTADGFIEETTPLAGCFVARDLEPTGPVVKVYVYPGLKAAELGLTNLEMVSQAIRSLPQYSSLNAEPLLEFLAEGTEKYGFETGIVGIDCKAPDEGARIKIYVRAPHTSTAYLMDCLTLGGRLPPGPGSEGAVQDLLAFWDAFLGEAPDVLPADLPGRASPGFYYTVGATPTSWLACGGTLAPGRRTRRPSLTTTRRRRRTSTDDTRSRSAVTATTTSAARCTRTSCASCRTWHRRSSGGKRRRCGPVDTRKIGHARRKIVVKPNIFLHIDVFQECGGSGLW
ncbi:hypothetical protein RB595_003617 [Gaeumannomyces hyphopodioides]